MILLCTVLFSIQMKKSIQPSPKAFLHFYLPNSVFRNLMKVGQTSLIWYSGSASQYQHTVF